MDAGALTYYLYRLAGAIAPHIPPRLGYYLADRVGDLAYRRSPLRRNVIDNISHVISEPAASLHVQSIARQVFRNQSKNYYDLFRLPALSPAEIRQAVREVSGLEHLDSALSKGHGVVLVSAHFGNFDLAAQILALHGYRATGVAEHLRPERLFRYVCAARESHGLKFVPINGSLRPVFRALEANEIVGLAMDRNVTDAGRAVTFFGQPARLPDGYLKLALLTRAALMAGFCYRLADNAFSLTIEPEIELERSGDLERDINANMPKALAVFERYLRRRPEQWVYFQPVWLLEDVTMTHPSAPPRSAK